MLRILFSLLFKSIFSFGFIEALDSKLILNTLKKGITSAMECADVVGFTFAPCTLCAYTVFLCKFISSLIYMQFCEYFLWVKAIEVNSLAVS